MQAARTYSYDRRARTWMKTCNTCGLHLPVSEYYRDRSSSDGYRAACTFCTMQRRRTKKRR